MVDDGAWMVDDGWISGPVLCSTRTIHVTEAKSYIARHDINVKSEICVTVCTTYTWYAKKHTRYAARRAKKAAATAYEREKCEQFKGEQKTIKREECNT